jgi:transcriptional antiterminator RfaH
MSEYAAITSEHAMGESLNWYCARTKPKSEHIAAANLRRLHHFDVFHPRLRSVQTTRAGVVKNIVEPLFPGYVFVRCDLTRSLDQVRHTFGVSSLVSFGTRIPQVSEDLIGELMECFGVDETLAMERHPRPGDTVNVVTGAFFGMQAVVLRSWPAKRRVQILLEILGRPTPMEVDSSLVAVEGKSIAEMLPEAVIQA